MPLLWTTPPPFHQPFFDLESVFWCLYVYLIDCALSSVGDHKFQPLAATVYSFQNDARATEKLASLTQYWGMADGLGVKVSSWANNISDVQRALSYEHL